MTATKARFDSSFAGDVWARLVAADFMNQAFILAALLMICVIPFLMVLAALAGADYVDNISRHLGLNDEAAADVRALFAPGEQTLAATTIGGLLALAIFTCATAAVIRSFYVRIFEVEPDKPRGVWRIPVWVAVAVGVSSAFVALERWSEVVAVAISLALAFAFWWWSLHFLLAGRRTWRYLLPAAVATALFWAGLRVFSVLAMSSAVVTNEDTYGPIGVVFVLLMWLIAVGVVILLGAGVGAAWRERRPALEARHD